MAVMAVQVGAGGDGDSGPRVKARVLALVPVPFAGAALRQVRASVAFPLSGLSNSISRSASCLPGKIRFWLLLNHHPPPTTHCAGRVSVSAHMQCAVRLCPSHTHGPVVWVCVWLQTAIGLECGPSQRSCFCSSIIIELIVVLQSYCAVMRR